MTRKKSDAVIAAEAEVASADEALRVARLAYDEAGKRCAQAAVGLRAAREMEDNDLPHCRMVKIFRGEEDVGSVVIVRQTPGGVLIVRRPGHTNEQRFKFCRTDSRFKQADKWASFTPHLELRDVPKQFITKEYP